MLSSLRSRLVLSSAGLSLAVLALLLAVSYASIDRFLEDSNRATTLHNLQIALDVLDYEVVTLKQLMAWVAVSTPVQNFLTLKESDEAGDRRRLLAAHEVLHSALYGNVLSLDLRKFLVVDRRGRALQLGSVPGHWSDGEVARRTVTDRQEAVIADPYKFSAGDPVLALGQVVTDDYSGQALAWIQAVLGTEFLSRTLSGYSFAPESRVYLVLGGQVLALGADRRFVPTDLGPGRFEGADARSFVTYQGKGTGWKLVQSLPRTQFDRQNSVFLLVGALVAGAMVLLVVLILMLVDRMVNRPVTLLKRRLAAVADGDFGFDPGIEFRHELGDIGRGVNAMARSLERHIVHRLQDEGARKDLEYQLLQGQINPHFLYNTLNSIKWMAEIQKARGIAEMAGSLGVLLKHLAQGTEALIPLDDELALVREYFTIQEFRTGQLAQLKVVVEGEALGRCLVPKFTLQPLVENALQHGIEPTGRPGTIVIRAHAEGETLRIDVTDDGAGIPPDRLAGLWDHAPRTTGQAFSPVGLSNVNERIQRRFGPQFGLKVTSEPGVYTTVSVRLPRETGEEGTDGPGADR